VKPALGKSTLFRFDTASFFPSTISCALSLIGFQDIGS
jgi:hypothetical protein